MAENLVSSPQSAKGSTRRTAKLTQGEALEVLASALKICREMGIKCGVQNLYDAGTVKTIVVLEGVRMVDDRMEVMG